nr:hypothetical protein [Clostridia bacterium]
MSNNCWLPKCEYYDSSQPWIDYEDFLYSIFRTDFIDSHPEFEGKGVRIRFHPIENNKEEAFYHATCQDYRKDGERVPDFRRCERIRWVRAFIENYNCDPSKCTDCDGIKVWEKPYKNNQRIHLLFEEERYIVVVYCIIKVPKVAEQNPQSCMRNFPIIASDVWYFPKPIYPI